MNSNGGLLGLTDDDAMLAMAMANQNDDNPFGNLMMMAMMNGNGNQPQGAGGSSQNYMQPSSLSIPNMSIPSGFNPKLQAALPGIMEDLQAKGWQPTIASGMRTPEEQAEKVRLGYSQTMNSKHLVGKAADIVDKRYGWDGPAANQNYQFWQDLGNAARSHGLQWGGDWKNFKDVAHVQTALNNQMPPGLLTNNTYTV